MRGSGQIVGMPGRVDAVDAHEHLARAEAAGLDRLDHLLARLLLGVGRDRVLQVEDHAVDRQRPRLVDARGRSSPACRARCGAGGWSCGGLRKRAAVAASATSRASVAAMGDKRQRSHGSRGSTAARAAGSPPLSGRRGDEARVRIVRRFADILSAPEAPAVIAVDMPIGLPERIGPLAAARRERGAAAARGAAVLGVLGAVARCGLCAGLWRGLSPRARNVEPPRKVSKQLFNITPKIREVDETLRAAPTEAARVFEVHPELAFWRLNRDGHSTSRRRSGAGPIRRDWPCGGGCSSTAGLPRIACMPKPPGPPARTICSMRWPAPQSHAASTPARRGRSRTRRRATRTGYPWRSGHDACFGRMTSMSFPERSDRRLRRLCRRPAAVRAAPLPGACRTRPTVRKSW